jgi:hypothetical protein
VNPKIFYLTYFPQNEAYNLFLLFYLIELLIFFNNCPLYLSTYYFFTTSYACLPAVFLHFYFFVHSSRSSFLSAPSFYFCLYLSRVDTNKKIHQIKLTFLMYEIIKQKFFTTVRAREAELSLTRTACSSTKRS